MVFNRKPDPSPSDSLASQARGAERATQSVIGSDLSIEGQSITIRCKGSLKVLGNIQADLHSKELEVGKEANIQGAIAAHTVDVFGRVSGSILGTHVVLHSSAEVDGDIHSHLLSIEQGAAFDGRSRRVANPAEIAPQLERPAAGAHASHLGIVPTPPHHLSS